MRHTLLSLSLVLLTAAEPCFAQDAADVDSTLAEQPMGGIGLDYNFSSKHLPQSRMHSELVLELFTDPATYVVGCSVVFPQNAIEDEAAYCRRPLGKRTGFAAIGPDGEAAYGVGRVRVRSNRPDWHPLPADLEIVVSVLPGGRSRLDFNILAYIDAQGQLQNCQRGSVAAAWAVIACRQAAGHSFQVRTDKDGMAVPYVANMPVAFIVE